MNPSDVSVVIPARNEQSVIAAAISSALKAGAVDVIVSDGGSEDDTVAQAKTAGATNIVHSRPGRGTQLKTGVAQAGGQYVLFLHADSQLGPQCLHQICDAHSPVWGAFQQQIDYPGAKYRLLEFGNAWRIKIRRMPFGDQAMFVRTKDLQQQGGIADIHLMEDVDLSRRLRRIARPVLLEGPVIVNPRRWQQRGVVRQTLRNWSIQSAYALGASPQRLANWYRREP